MESKRRGVILNPLRRNRVKRCQTKVFLEIISNSNMMKSCDSLLIIETKYENEKSQNIFEFFKANHKQKFKKKFTIEHVFFRYLAIFAIKGKENDSHYIRKTIF